MSADNSLFTALFDAHADVLARTRAECLPQIAAMRRAWADCIRAGGKIMFFGNGGSAGDAQHLAAELSVRFKADRAPIAGLALTTDSSVLTATGNDMGFEQLFARQVEALGRPGDLAVGITTSGKSANVTAALVRAKALGMTAAALTGGEGGDLKDLADPMIIVPSTTTARIQEMHILIGQILCEALEIDLGLVSPPK